MIVLLVFQNLFRDGLEALFVVAIAGMLVSAIKRLRSGEVQVYHCPHCGRPTSRAYPRCRHCDRGLNDTSTN